MKLISENIARQLIDFKGNDNSIEDDVAIEQLNGAVKLYNILETHKTAYLADEVGKGKTYVALGTVHLLKHFYPGFKTIYIVPGENIQRKWKRDEGNFIQNNWLLMDHKVKTFGRKPVRPMQHYGRLFDYYKDILNGIDMDPILRMHSFSLAIPDSSDGSKKNELKALKNQWQSLQIGGRIAPPDSFDTNEIKDWIATLINNALPTFDIVVIDEGHKLRHGINHSATRNRLLSSIFGNPPKDFTKAYRNFLTPKYRHSLILSATPMEYQYSDIKRQIAFFKPGIDPLPEIPDMDTDSNDHSEESQKDALKRIMIRRLTGLQHNNQILTKNQYRLEWRKGGTTDPEKPLEINNVEGKLTLALIQKNVTTILSKRKIQNKSALPSFQIGMLSSFESFQQTLNCKIDEQNIRYFDGQDNVDSDKDEQRGVDTRMVENLMKSYEEKFNKTLPHPKMDVVVDEVFQAFLKGRKSLIFVRRIGSVREIRQKLAEKYDAWLRDYIIGKIKDSYAKTISDAFENYITEHRKEENKNIKKLVNTVEDSAIDENGNLIKTVDEIDEKTGYDTFFSYYFRGKAAAKEKSPRSFKKNRAAKEDSNYSILLEDNYIYSITKSFLKNTDTKSTTDVLLKFTGLTKSELHEKVKDYYSISIAFNAKNKLDEYLNYQYAILAFLSQLNLPGELEQIKTYALILSKFIHQSQTGVVTTKNAYRPDQAEIAWNQITLFTLIQDHSELSEYIYDTLDRSPRDNIKDYLRERDEKKTLLSRIVLLGHSFIDYWLAFLPYLTNDGNDEKAELHEPLHDFIQTLEKQLDQFESKDERLSAFYELHAASKYYPQLRKLNFPAISDKEPGEINRYLGTILGEQSPFSGMYSKTNKTYIQQFRMPLYPMVLISTDVLQEGEDLHTFCDRIIHYGISPMPSAIEQKIGRLDRVGSLLHRKIKEKKTDDSEQSKLENERKLHIFYPHVKGTYEQVQIVEVYRRLNEFYKKMHENLSLPDKHSSEIYIDTNILNTDYPPPISDEKPLVSPFYGDSHIPKEEIKYCFKKVHQDNELFKSTFKRVEENLMNTFHISLNSDNDIENGIFHGTMYIYHTNQGQRHVILSNERVDDIDHKTIRLQPFQIRPVIHHEKIILHIVSPVDQVKEDILRKHSAEIIQIQQNMNETRICLNYDRFSSYNLTVEADILLNLETFQNKELHHALKASVIYADLIEIVLSNHEKDADLSMFIDDLNRELSK